MKNKIIVILSVLCALFLLTPVRTVVQQVINGSQIFVTGAYVGYQTPNSSSTGTTVNKIAKISGSGLVISATTDVAGMVGIVTSGAGTTGNGVVAVFGQASCVFDGATTKYHYVINSTTTAGDCSDSGIGPPSLPPSSQTFGQVLSTNGGAGTYLVQVASDTPGQPAFTSTICSGTVVMGTSAIASAATGNSTAVTCTGMTSADSPTLISNSNIFAITGFTPSTSGILTISCTPSANTLTCLEENNTAGSVTPGTVTINYRLVR